MCFSAGASEYYGGKVARQSPVAAIAVVEGGPAYGIAGEWTADQVDGC